ncbi:hypothetical protein SAMN06295879_0260 [Agreia bicolorata]|uniref:Uncharacterized protein n=1 Tax=Agreia bicolorata TaxID=110935 RepID=A0A1T4WWE5_9MICO|nr:hypothetical protein [Agreia bicolorata]SKA80941.1 hypothetical protein SAMN06295879_0260 [Agreia bicolorata]
MSTRWTRVARGSLAAGFSTFVAAFSHALAGGTAPSVAALSLAIAFSTMICVALAGRGLSYWRIGASVAVSQVFFHTLFSLIATPAAHTVGARPAAHSGHDMAAMFAPTGPAASNGMAITIDVAMVAGHVLAAIATFAAIIWGERAVRGLLAAALLRTTRLASLLLPTPVFAPRAVRLGRVHRIDAPAMLEVLRASLWHRGPPLFA